MLKLAIASLVVGLQLQMATASTILLYPYSNGLNSRLMNMEKMSKILIQEGYTVSMLVSSEYDEQRRVPGVTLLKFPSPAGVGGLNDPETVEGLIDISLADFADLIQIQQLAYCDSLLRQKKLLQRIKSQKFDLFILDYIDTCGRILIDFVDVPSILYSNFGFSVEPEIFSPMPLAYAPMPLSPLSDHMTFLQRVRNVLEYGLTLLLYRYALLPAFQRLRYQHNMNVSLSVEDSFTRAQLVMVNTEFGFDYPRPVMPNIVTIGGLFHEPARPLQGEVRDFVETAPGGVIVVSFGSIIDRLERSKAEILAQTFARLPFRFVWRLKGRRPDGLGNNTMLMDWLPQNDLLGHPKTVAFVSHCGSSAAHEAINHAVPVIAIPMVIDQFYQATKLVESKMAVQLSWHTLTKNSLTSAIYSATHNDDYKRNARRTSRRLRDQPVRPRQKFTLWVDYLLRNGDADHLNSAIAHKLPWYQLFLLDVFLFLAAVTAVLVYLLKVLLTAVYQYVSMRLNEKMKME